MMHGQKNIKKKHVSHSVK